MLGTWRSPGVPESHRLEERETWAGGSSPGRTRAAIPAPRPQQPGGRGARRPPTQTPAVLCDRSPHEDQKRGRVSLRLTAAGGGMVPNARSPVPAALTCQVLLPQDVVCPERLFTCPHQLRCSCNLPLCVPEGTVMESQPRPSPCHSSCARRPTHRFPVCCRVRGPWLRVPCLPECARLIVSL